MRNRFTYSLKILISGGFIILFFSLFAVGQKNDKWFELGKKAFAEKDYPRAIEYFRYDLRKDSSAATLSALGDSYLRQRDYYAAAQAYRSAVKMPGVKPETHFNYAISLMHQKRYDDARSEMMMFAQKTKGSLDATEFRDLPAFIDRVMNDTSSTVVAPLKINSPASDFGLVSGPGGFYFASSRNRPAVLHTSTVNNAPLLDLFFVAVSDSGKWGKPEPVKGDINTKYNEGPVCFAENGKKMYFTRNDYLPGTKTNKKGKVLNRLKIYEATWGETGWTDIRELPFNGSEFATGHPAWDEKNKRLWFASDRPGSVGGTDLWYVNYASGNWTSPVNPGATLNTTGDDLFPVISSDGVLTFSSDGRLGLGGLDIYSAKKSGNGYQVSNLGYPINSNADDFYLFSSTGGRSGYLSSNRGKAHGNDDLYSFVINLPQFECDPQEENNYCFTFFNTDTVEFDFDTIPIIYEWDFGDGTRARGEIADHCFAGPGNYQVRLNLIDTTIGYVFLNQITYDFEVADIEQVFIDIADTIPAGKEVALDGSKSVVPGYQIEEWYLDTGDGFAKSSIHSTVRFEVPGSYVLRLGVVAVQPDGGRINKCISKTIVVLPEERIRQIRDSLARIIPPPQPERVTIPDSIRKQFLTTGGTLTDIGDSTNKSYTVQLLQSETPLNLNEPRFREIGTVTEHHQNGIYNYTVGNEPTLQDIYPHYRRALDKGFTDALVVALKEGNILSGNDSTLYLRVKGEKEPVRLRLITGKVTDENGNPLEASVKVQDLSQNLTIEQLKSDDNTGEFFIRLPDGKLYGFIAERSGYLSSSTSLDLLQPGPALGNNLNLNQTLRMEPVEKAVSSGQVMRLNNIFFDFDSDKLRPESAEELNRFIELLRQNPQLNAEIMGHTDDQGPDVYNFDLSQRRAASVVRYLVNGGISLNRVSARGYGESLPSVANDSEENRQFNRRVEFRLMRR